MSRRWQPPTNTIHRLETKNQVSDRWSPVNITPFVTLGIAREVAQGMLAEHPWIPVRIVTYRARTVREVVPKKKRAARGGK